MKPSPSRARLIPLSFIVLLLLVPVGAHAATATVSTCSMGVAGSLDTLIAAASSGDTIDFSVNCSGVSAIQFTSKITIHDKSLVIDGTGHTIELDGGWSGTYITDPNDPDYGYPDGGTALFNVFTNGSTPFEVSFIHLTFQNGNGLASSGPAGAINNTRDDITITDCTFRGNVGNDGGALFAQNASTFTITGSTFTGNVSPAGIAPNSGIGAVLYNAGTISLTNCTLTGNQITHPLGGTGGVGGAIYTGSGKSTTLTGCTISGNGGAAVGGGLWGPATVSNSIIYGNSASTGPDAYGTYTSDGTNLIGNTSGATGFSSDIVGEDPLLGSLGDHGGLTQTIPLLPGSPAIDAIVSADCLTSTDQRGVSRASIPCDIGAFESHGFSLALSGGDGQSTNVSTAFATPLGVTITATEAGSPWFEPVDGGAVTYTAPASGASATFASNPVTIASGAASVVATANATGGSYTVTASAAGASTGVDFSLTNIAPLVITTTSVPNGTYLQSYSQTITATGGTGSGYTFSVGSGSLPSGITLSTGGSLSGTPAEAGTFNFTVHAVDDGSGSDDQALTLVIDPIGCVVDSTADPTDAGHITLRDAVNALNANACTSDLITFDATAFPPAGPMKTITLASGGLGIPHDGTVQGTGARLLTVDGNNSSSIFTVGTGHTVEISGMTLQNGDSPFGSALDNQGTLTARNLRVTSNTGSYGGAIHNIGTLTLLGSTVSGNSTDTEGGGIWSDGTLDIANSTIAGNTSPDGEAIFVGGGTATITNTTIAGNGDGSGNAVLAQSSGTVTVTNTLIGNNSSPNCTGTIGSGGHNIDDDSTCSFAGTGDLSGASVVLGLGSLADNGGPTDTFALHGGSQAIDAGDAAVCSAAPISGLDQRGLSRPAGAGCDIGALEAVQHTLDVTVSGPGSLTASGAAAISGSIASCTANCSALYSGEDGGDAVTLTEAPATGAYFSAWGADCSAASGSTAALTMDADHACTAAFAWNPPTVTVDSFELAARSSFSGSIVLDDPAGGTLTVNIIDPPDHGILVGPDGNGDFTYTPEFSWDGTDSFTFTVTSSVSGLTSAPATIALQVDPPPTVPTLDPRALAALALLLAAVAAWRLRG